jgi:hypothetical protein
MKPPLERHCWLSPNPQGKKEVGVTSQGDDITQSNMLSEMKSTTLVEIGEGIVDGHVRSGYARARIQIFFVLAQTYWSRDRLHLGR